MKYKLMAVDVDGTLLDSRGNLTEETIKAVRLAVDKGLIFTISSGRPVQGVMSLTEKLGLDLPVITFNGAMIITAQTREILFEKKLSPCKAESIVRLGEEFGTTVAVWSENRLYVNRLNERALRYGKNAGVQPIMFTDLHEVIKNGVLKVLWYDDVEVIEKYEREMGRYLSGGINFHTSQPYYLEFVDEGASKAIALEKLGEHFGIKREEIIAAGDGFNDLSMIEYAGLGVAMGNAKDEIKRKADYIAPTNDENGVAHVIYKFVLDG